MTIGELIHSYRVLNLMERRREDPRHAHWWVEHFGTVPLSELTTERLRHALEQVRVDGRTGTRAGSTVAFYLRFLRRVTAWGKVMGYLPVDPCLGIPLPKEKAPKMRVLTEEEEGQLCQAFGPPYSLWIRFAILTGLEQSEQFTLLWRSVQLEQGTVLVPQGTNGAMVELSLPPDAVTILRVLRQQSPSSLWVFSDPRNPTRPADPHNFYVTRWTRTIEHMGLRRVTWKDLRHTCGVRLAKEGVPIQEIAGFLRQRELRQAYRYRAWRPEEQTPVVTPTVHQPVFQEITSTDLQALLARDMKAQPLTFGDVCRFYAVHHLKARPARRNFDALYRRYFTLWADRRLEELTRREVRLWHGGQSENPAQANKAVNFIRAVYNWAATLDLYDGANPAIGRFRFTCPPRERFLTTEEAQRFLEGIETLPPKPRAYLWTMLLTGARGIEIRSMRWKDIDWSTRLWTKAKTKNGKPQYLPLPLQVVTAIKKLTRTSEWVFSGVRGPWSADSAEKVWLLCRRRWNLGDVTLHDIRRTCASYLAISGENLPTIQNVLGHRSLSPTSIYAHLNTKAVDRALQAQADRFCQSIQTAGLIEQATPSGT